MLGLLVSMFILALLLYISYYDINKKAKKEDWIIKDDLEKDKKRSSRK